MGWPEYKNDLINQDVDINSLSSKLGFETG
jgi:hypothetical protein